MRNRGAGGAEESDATGSPWWLDVAYGLLTWAVVVLVFLLYLFCPVFVHAQIVEQAGGTNVLVPATDPPNTAAIMTFSQGECSPWPGTSKICASDADCDSYCTDVDEPSDCCTGDGSSSCTCEERHPEAFYRVWVAGPHRQRLTLTGSVQQLFGGVYTSAYECALWLEPEDAGPFCYGDATLETDCDNGVKVPWSRGTIPSDRRDASSLYVVGTSGEILNVECWG